MIEVKVGGMVVDKKSGSPVLLLRVPNTQRYLPIWIGPSEATAIDMVLRNKAFERPLTHDLLKHVIDGLGGTVSRIVITSLRENTFFAKIFITREHEIISIDARPSDSVALALRAKAPIFLSKELLTNHAVSLLPIEQEEGLADESIDNMLKSLQGDAQDGPGEGPGLQSDDESDEPGEGEGGGAKD